MPLIPSLSGSQVLLVTAVTNGAFCVSQGIASQLSHSLALLGDSIDMAADTVTYSLAWWIERRKEAGRGRLPLRFAVGELAVALASGASLVAGAVGVVVESFRRYRGGERASEDVNQIIIFCFAGVNLLVNLAQLALFLSRNGSDGDGDGGRAAPPVSCCNPLSPLDAAVAREGGAYEMVNGDGDGDGGEAARGGDGDGDGGEAARGGCCGNINVGASLAHVGADTMRTFSELTAAFVIQVFETDSVRTDAIAAIVINATIFLSGLYICYEVAVRARLLWRLSRPPCEKCPGTAPLPPPGALL